MSRLDVLELSISPGSAAARPRGRTAPPAHGDASLGDGDARRRERAVAHARARRSVGDLGRLRPRRARGVDGRRCSPTGSQWSRCSAGPSVCRSRTPRWWRAQGPVRADARGVLPRELRERAGGGRADPASNTVARAGAWGAERANAETVARHVMRNAGQLVEHAGDDAARVVVTEARRLATATPVAGLVAGAMRS